MQALEITLLFMWLIPIAIGIWFTWLSNKDDEKNKNHSGPMDDNHLRWQDVDFHRSQQPTVDSDKNDN